MWACLFTKPSASSCAQTTWPGRLRELSTRLAKTYGTVVVEDLAVKTITASAKGLSGIGGAKPGSTAPSGQRGGRGEVHGHGQVRLCETAKASARATGQDCHPRRAIDGYVKQKLMDHATRSLKAIISSARAM